MSVTWRHLPAPARTVAVAASDAVAAAQEHDPDRFEVAVGTLAAAEGAGLVLGAVVRLLLEQQHPDGLDGDDVRRILEDSVRAATVWQPTIDPHIVLVVLVGALGIHDQDDQDQAPRPSPEVLARHGCLLVADLLAATSRPLGWYLTAAFAEIERTELHD